jgi:hypothetical protein
VTAVLHTTSGYHGYLNATPRQGGERLQGWAAFRLGFERSRGGTHISEVAAAEGLSFRGGRGSCVIDDYNSPRLGGHRYREIACFVVGARASTVVIAAAPLAEWPGRAPLLERAVSTFRVH